MRARRHRRTTRSHGPLLVALVALVALVVLVAAGAVSAQEPPRVPAAIVVNDVAPGGRVEVRATGVQLPFRVQVRVADAWVPRGPFISVQGKPSQFRAPGAPTRLRLRVLGADGEASPSRFVRVRPLTLAAVGDINLADGPGAAIDRFGAAYPWQGVGPRLRAADLAFGNLESAVSSRGRRQVKQFTFRGRPSSMRAVAKIGGLDVLNLANNHTGDFGADALLDTLRSVRANGMTVVGAGAGESQAYRPAVVERLGLKIAFVGFSTINPMNFRAVGNRPGTAWGFPDRVRSSVRAAAAQADVVIATFHWGVELDRFGSAQQRSLARTAFDAGATAVIGAHPHVLQPIRRPRKGRLVAYSLGNFVFSPQSPGTDRTGILELGLGASGVLSDRLLPARIVGDRPVLTG